MTKTETYGLYGAALVIGFLVVQKITAKPAQASTGSLSGLTGGSLSSIASSIGKGISSVFGHGSPSDQIGDNSGSTWGTIPSPPPGALLDFNANLQPEPVSNVGPVASGDTYGSWLDPAYGV